MNAFFSRLLSFAFHSVDVFRTSAGFDESEKCLFRTIFGGPRKTRKKNYGFLINRNVHVNVLSLCLRTHDALWCAVRAPPCRPKPTTNAHIRDWHERAITNNLSFPFIFRVVFVSHCERFIKLNDTWETISCSHFGDVCICLTLFLQHDERNCWSRSATK